MTTFSDRLYEFGGIPVGGDGSGNSVWGTAYFVDATNGSDSNTGKSPEAAMATIQAALNKTTASKGDKVYVRNGAYAETLTMTKADVHLIGQSRDGVVITGDTNATDVLTITGSDCSVRNASFRGFDTGSDITHIAVDADNCKIDNCHFSGNENQIEVTTVDYCIITNCDFVTPDDTTDGICIRFEDANDCKVLGCNFQIDTASDAILHHDADRLEVAYCVGVGDDDTSAGAGSFVLINGADATSQLSVHDNRVTLFAAVVTEVSTAVAAHGLGTADLPVTATVDTSIEIPVGFQGNSAEGCTLFFDTAE